MRPATSEELQHWDKLVAANPDGGNVLQLKAFGEVKDLTGWQPKYLMINSLAILALCRNIPGLGDFWYVPKGPGVVDVAGLKSFAAHAKALTSRSPFAIRIDPEINGAAIKSAAIKKLGYHPAPRHIQYNVTTAIVDLNPTEEDILASFKQKTRYNIRLAAKKGVTVEAANLDNQSIDTMYRLYQTTTKRAGVYLRSRSYFADFWQRHADSGNGQMFFAKYEGQVLAGAYITFVGHKALYKDGGSVREHTEVQAPYALQWEIMRWLKSHGITEYDLHGTPPADQIDNPKHPLAGLARFKTGFQPNITEYIGTFDLVLDPQKYDLWCRIGERLSTSYEYRIKKRLFY